MKVRYVTLILILVSLALAAGWWGRGFTDDHSSHSASVEVAEGPCPGGVQALYWKAPMDPAYIREAPGKSPMGMDLVPECPSASGGVPDGAIVVDSATMQNMGVKTTSVVRRDLSRTIRAVGRVAYDERRVSHMHTKVQGWVETLHVDFVGQSVKKGQPLLEIYSPELVATQEELLLAARYREATEESPFDDVRNGGDSLFDATRRRLALWDIPERDIKRLLETGNVKRTLTLYAPASGVITHLGVRSGMEVKPNSNLYTLADLSRVWVLADVYEYELPWLELGQIASVELSYLPGDPMQGELTYIAPFLDPKTRTAEVRLELDNTAGQLRPEMFGNAVIAGAPRLDTLVIPSSAVLRSGRRNVAIVALGDGRFEPRDITLGLDSGDGLLEVLSGLSEGEKVVTSSQFLIDSESNLQEAHQKFRSAASEEAPSSQTDQADQTDPTEQKDHADHGDHKEHSMPDTPTEPMDHTDHTDHSMHGSPPSQARE